MLGNLCESIARALAPSLVAGLFLLPLLCRAEPYEPAGGDTVLLTLSPALQQHWLQQTNGLSTEQRLTQAGLLLAAARRAGDNEAYGQAEALLQPLVMQTVPVAEAWYLMAHIKQHNHEFPAALVLLDRLLAQQPGHHAARLQRAQIHLVTAAYAAARQDCQALAYQISHALVTSCAAQVAALTGQAETALQAVQQMLATGGFTADDRFELLLTQATIAEQLGDDAQAQGLYLNLLALSPNSPFVLQHLADLSLRSGNTADTVALLQTRLDASASLELQVTLLQALRGQGDAGNLNSLVAEGPATAFALRETLEAQFAAAKSRGGQDFPHKEFARFALHVSHNYPAALQAARENWRVQKEPGDLLLLTLAAKAAGDERILAEVEQWLSATALQDQRITELLRQVSL